MMAKQDTQDKIENVNVPADAEGNVTVETVDTLNAVKPKVPGSPLGGPLGQETSREQHRDQRREQQRESREQPRSEGSQPRPEGTQPQQASGDEERSITIALSPRQWALVDRQIERTGRTESEWWRRFLAPHLRP